jgi:membrane protease YdiL (CAAX protease family)
VGEGHRDRQLDVIGCIPLAIALIVFPSYKLAFVDQTGDWWAAWYLVAEAFIAVLCVLSLRRERRPLSDAGVVRPSRAWWLALGAVIVVAAILLALREFDVIVMPAERGRDYGALSAPDTAGRLLAIIGSAIAVPLEEFIWRGFAISTLRRWRTPTWLAVLVPAVAFGAFHASGLDLLYVGVIVGLGSVVLGVIFLRTRSIAWPVLMHFGWNCALIALVPG